MTRRILALLGQCIALGAFFLMVGYFSVAPTYVHRDPDAAQILASFSHTGARVHECRQLSAAEIDELAPNMRRSMDCPRGRLPLAVQIELDGELLYAAQLPPAGIANDGASFVYARLAVPTGRHSLVARLRDSRRENGFDHVREEIIELAARQNFTIDFRPETGGFMFR